MIPPKATGLVFLVAALLATQLVAQAPAPPPPDPAWDSAAIAWDEGRYPDALARLERLLSGDAAGQYLERVALLTGELFRTTEVAPDGRTVRWSPGGRYAAIETGLGPARRTVLLRFENDAFTRTAELAGYGLVFAPGDGFAAFVSAEGVRDFALAGGAQRTIPTTGIRVRSLLYAPDGTLLASAGADGDTTAQVYALGPQQSARLTSDPGGKTLLFSVGGAMVYGVNRDRIAIRADTGEVWRGAGVSPAISADGRMLAFIARSGAEFSLMVVPVAGGQPRGVVRRTVPMTAPAWSPDGRFITYQAMLREDWEVLVVAQDGSADRRLTREIQHDLVPVFLDRSTVLEKIGEARHRRSYLIDLTTGARTRLFHNNTVRTVSPEYAWAPSPDGTKILVVADRDGNTVSPERGVYLVDLSRRVSVDDVLSRVRVSLAAERDLRERGQRMYAPIAARVQAAVADVAVSRIDRYAADLFSFDSKYITQPGNRRAIEYLTQQLRSFGYEPVLQEFEPRGTRTANVVATLRGTVDPDLTYVVSSHFDSVEGGPGSDDNTSGTSALLEAARVMASRPQRATIQFAWFTGEEAGLLGSREYVRRARADSVKIVGALNNDMVGWMNDSRFDNTIRYSNDGLRDVQHAAAFGFTNLITYDSRYYQNTDAHAYYEVYGDIVGGIGSYPILGNPHYHQTHDVLETVDQRLVAEVSKTTIATLMLMASSPSRLAGVSATWENGRATVSWQPAKEHGITGYRVAYGPESDPMRTVVTVRTPRAVLPATAVAGTRVAVKAVMANAMEGWDWARATVPSR